MRAQPGDEAAKRTSAATEKELGYAPVNGLKMYYEIHGGRHVDKPPLVTSAWAMEGGSVSPLTRLRSDQ